MVTLLLGILLLLARGANVTNNTEVLAIEDVQSTGTDAEMGETILLLFIIVASLIMFTILGFMCCPEYLCCFCPKCIRGCCIDKTVTESYRASSWTLDRHEREGFLDNRKDGGNWQRMNPEQDLKPVQYTPNKPINQEQCAPNKPITPQLLHPNQVRKVGYIPGPVVDQLYTPAPVPYPGVQLQELVPVGHPLLGPTSHYVVQGTPVGGAALYVPRSSMDSQISIG